MAILHSKLKQFWPWTLMLPILALFVGVWVESRADSSTSEASNTLARQVILRNNCGSCHTLQVPSLELTGKVGPDLTHQAQRSRSKEWLRRQLTDPLSIPDGEVAGGFEGKQKFMPRFLHLSDRELSALVEFLHGLD